LSRSKNRQVGKSVRDCTRLIVLLSHQGRKMPLRIPENRNYLEIFIFV
jgi:hypothetical protein